MRNLAFSQTLVDSRVLYQKMKEKDYSPIIETAVRECGVKTDERAKELLDAFLQWFALIPNSSHENPLQMVRSVDRMWHAMVLNTKFYRDFCFDFFGYIIDHNPLDVVRNPDEEKKKYAKYTIDLLKNTYGEDVHPALLDLNQEITCCIGCGPSTPTNP